MWIDNALLTILAEKNYTKGIWTKINPILDLIFYGWRLWLMKINRIITTNISESTDVCRYAVSIDFPYYYLWLQCQKQLHSILENNEKLTPIVNLL